MENIEEKVSDLSTDVNELAKTWYRLSLVNATQKAVNLSSAGIATIIVVLGGIFVLLLASFALSWWLGDVLESRAGGFLLGAAFFLIITIVLVLLRKKIVFPFFRDMITRKLYD